MWKDRYVSIAAKKGWWNCGSVDVRMRIVDGEETEESEN